MGCGDAAADVEVELDSGVGVARILGSGERERERVELGVFKVEGSKLLINGARLVRSESRLAFWIGFDRRGSEIASLFLLFIFLLRDFLV